MLVRRAEISISAVLREGEGEGEVVAGIEREGFELTFGTGDDVRDIVLIFHTTVEPTAIPVLSGVREKSSILTTTSAARTGETAERGARRGEDARHELLASLRCIAAVRHLVAQVTHTSTLRRVSPSP
jgi:hypothetical protein